MVGFPAIYNIQKLPGGQIREYHRRRTPDETVVLVTQAEREVLFCCTGVQPPVNRGPRSLVLFPLMILSFKVDPATLV